MSNRSRDGYLEAQIGVLGSIMLDARWAGEAIQHTNDDDYTGEYRTIFRAIKTLFRDGRPIDPVTIRSIIGSEYTELLLQLMELTPTAVNCGEYIKLTLEQARLTKLKNLAMLIAECPNLEHARELMTKANQFLVSSSSVRVMSIQDGYVDFVSRQAEKPELISWEYSPVDQVLMVEPGDLVVLGGYPSAGKTAFSLQLAWSQSLTKKVGYFSLETKPEKLIDRTMAAVCGMEFEHIKKHTLTQEEWELCAIKKNEFSNRKLDVIQAGNLSVLDIQALTLSNSYEVIYIDYLQLIRPEDRRKSEFEQVSQISRDLHTMAATTGVTICALSQLSRPKVEGKQEKAPGLHSLRQSGQIEQDADAVMLLYKEEPNRAKSRRCLKIAKNKEGPAGGLIMLDFDGSKQKFSQSFGPPPKVIEEEKEPEYKQMNMRELPENEYVPF